MITRSYYLNMELWKNGDWERTYWRVKDFQSLFPKRLSPWVKEEMNKMLLENPGCDILLKELKRI